MKKAFAIIAVVAVAIWLLMHIRDANQRANVQQRFENLSDEYLHPDFSAEFCHYWRITDLVSYRTALKQQFDQESDDEMSAAYGNDEDELLYFFHLRMNNWMEREMIFRAEWLYAFDNRGNKKEAPFSLAIYPAPITPANSTATPEK